MRDPHAQNRLRDQLEGKRVRIRGTFGERRASSLTLDEEGIHLPEAAALDTLGATPSLMRWEDIQSVAIRKRAAGTGALYGMAAGILAGIGFAIVNDDEINDPLGSAVALGLTLSATATGAGVGALIGSRVDHWETVYPEPPLGGHDAYSKKPFLKPVPPRR
jgi:hypothetical protein